MVALAQMFSRTSVLPDIHNGIYETSGPICLDVAGSVLTFGELADMIVNGQLGD